MGVAIRCAQSLGMHLINTTPTLTQHQKDHRAMVWFSVLALERNITVITGRPSMIRDRDCSITMPQLVAGEDSSQKAVYPPSATSVSSFDSEFEHLRLSHPHLYKERSAPDNLNYHKPTTRALTSSTMSS